jgi:hypothetical protein
VSERWAHVLGGVVSNVVVTSVGGPSAEYAAAVGGKLVQLGAGDVVSPGDMYDGTKFSPAPFDAAAAKAAVQTQLDAIASRVKALADGSLQAALAAATTQDQVKAIAAKLAGLA